MGADDFQGVADSFEDAGGVLQGIGVPEAQDGVAAGFQGLGAGFVFGSAFRVLAAIEFDDQARCCAEEVGNVAAYGCLTAEFIAIEATGAKVMP